MSDNGLQTLQRLVQDVIAPDVRELKVRQDSFEKRFEECFNSVERQISSLEKQSEAQYKGILAAISEAKAQSELSNMQAISTLRERVAILESHRN
jgi:hypothetical protein